MNFPSEARLHHLGLVSSATHFLILVHPCVCVPTHIHGDKYQNESMRLHLLFCCLCFPKHKRAPGDLIGQRDWRLQEIHHWRTGEEWDTDSAAELVPDGWCHLQKADQSETGPVRGSTGRIQHLQPQPEWLREHPRQAHEGGERAKPSVFMPTVVLLSLPR